MGTMTFESIGNRHIERHRVTLSVHAFHVCKICAVWSFSFTCTCAGSKVYRTVMKHVMKANICGRKAPHLLKFIPFVSCKKENPDLQATTMHPKNAHCPIFLEALQTSFTPRTVVWPVLLCAAWLPATLTCDGASSSSPKLKPMPLQRRDQCVSLFACPPVSGKSIKSLTVCCCCGSLSFQL